MRDLLLSILLCFTTNAIVAQTFGTESLTFTNNSGPYDMQNGNGTVNLTCGTVDELNIPLTVTNIGTLGAGSPSPAIESVTLNITHTYNSDVRLSLTDPSGMVTLDLINSGVGGPGNNFTNCTIIDGGGVFSIINTNSITGNYAPHGTGGFASFNIPATILADGDWTLNVCDAVNGDVGTIDDWSITFTIPTVYVPDDNFEQALIDLGYDSGPLDDYVPFSSINTITTLDVSNKNISDLTGIEAFTALESLVVHTNQLSTLNVTQNTLLTSLNCAGNSLTSINVTQNAALTSLSVAANQLTNLNLSQNINLQSLNCSGNQIQYLDLKENIALTGLYATSNALIQLNVKNGNNTNVTQFFINNNPNLSCIDVDDVSYSTTYWLNVDAGVSYSNSCFTYVPDDNFEQALIDLGYDSGPLDDYVLLSNINTITTLDVSNKNISDLTGIEAFTALESLVVHTNQLIALNVTQNTLLTSLNCEGNSLTSINVTQNTALTSLSVAANQLTDLNLSQNINLQSLNCSGNQIQYLDLKENIALTQLYATSNGLIQLNIKNGNNTNVTQFFINNNPNLSCIDVDDVSYSTTYWLNVDAGFSFSNSCFTYVPDDNFEAYLEANNYGNGIANDNYVSTVSVENIVDLDVSNKNISDLTGIEDFLNVSFLYVYDNNLTSIDVSNNANLTVLFCSNNNLTNLDVSNNSMLRRLYCSNNNLSSLNMKNGANHLILPEDPFVFIFNFTSINNPNLTCIQVDNVAYSNTNWLNKDAHTSFSETCTTYVPDTNFEQALIDLGYDTILDGQVETSNIFLVENLDVSNKNILDLTGIEGFVSLTNLNCSTNSLITLNLDKNVALNTLNVSNNALEFLTFKNGHNQLINTSVNFNTTGNPNLSCIQVDNAVYSTTTWTTIDSGTSFSELCLTYVPDTNFEAYLEANNYGNGIANDNYVLKASVVNIIDLEVGFENISDLTGIEDFINLSLLDLLNNNLTNLDISNNTKLTKLFCSGNSLTSIDVSNNLMLKTLDCSNNALTDLDVSNNNKLSGLYCSNNNLSSLNMKNGANHLILPEDPFVFFIYFNSVNNPNLTCIQVDNEAYSNANWLYKDAHTSFNEVSCQTVEIEPKIYLQGASLEPNTGEETLMRDNLRVANLVPTTSPYEDGLTTTNAVFTVTGNNAIVDWVWLELRDENDLTRIITSQSALLQRDGDVVATDGVSILSFAADHANYHVVLKHRNHLGIMTQNTVALSDVATSVDFTNAATQITYGTNAQTTFGMPTGIIAMWTGNANGDVAVQYSGTNPDTPSILSKVLNDAGNFLNFPTYITNGYDVFDINMDGNTQYSGTNPDTPFILQNVLAHPSNFLNFSTFQIQEQLPEN